MKSGRRVRVGVGVVLVLMAAAQSGRAADKAGVVAQLEAANKAAAAAYESGDFKRMKKEVAKAIRAGEKSALGAEPALAESYMLAGIVDVEGDENSAAGVRDFTKALAIRADAKIPQGMATTPVKLAFKKARGDAAQAAGGAPAAVTAADKGPAAPAPGAKASPPPPAHEAKAETKPEAKAETKPEAKAETKPEAKAEAKPDNELPSEKQKRAGAADQARPESDKQAQYKQLADAKARIAQLEKEAADKDKQLADARARLAQVDKDRADKDRQLADTKARLGQLDKDRADKDRQLAEARAREQKERATKEQLEKDRQLAEARLREAETKKADERRARERLLQGPEFPAHLPEPLHCAVPDEAPWRTDLYVHCAARPNVKARSIVFYYRTSGSRYFSLPMERSAKGWYTAMIPAAKMSGKVLQYYAEALDARDVVTATNGKEASPNILTLHPGSPRG
jgi:ribonuclease E